MGLRILLSILFIISLTQLSYALSKDDCFSCHGQKGTPLFLDSALYEESSHGKFTCNRCHLDIIGYPHGKASKVNCGICHFLGTEGAPKEKAQEYKLSVHNRALRAGNTMAPDCQACHGSHYIFPSKDERSETKRQKIPSLCSKCHFNEYEVYKKGIHGKEFLDKKNTGAAACFDCHMEHKIPGVEEEGWKLSLIKECGNCHSAELDTYRRTFHGKVTKLGYITVAKCSDCHGSHNILPVSDRDSTLSGERILDTCMKCHPKATVGFTKYFAHAEEHNRAKYPLLYYTYLFMTLLLLGVFAFFFTHTALWAYRSLMERIRKRSE
ncbi:MAG: hypothetical protein AABY44_07145 [Nitrospirota bacterium]